MWQIRYLSSSGGPHKNFWYVVYCFNVSHCIHNGAYICIMMPLTCWSPLELCLRLSDGCFAVADWTDSESNGGSNCWNIIKIRVNTHHILGRAGGQGGLGPPNFWDNVKTRCCSCWWPATSATCMTHITVYLYLWSLKAMHEVSRGPLKGAISAQKALQGPKTETRELQRGMEEKSNSQRQGWIDFLPICPPP